MFKGDPVFLLNLSFLCVSVKALKVVILSDWYPELIFTSITSPSMWSRILMKSPLQTIDLGNDEEEGIGQTCHFFFHRILSRSSLECEPVTALQFDGLVRCVVWWIFTAEDWIDLRSDMSLFRITKQSMLSNNTTKWASVPLTVVSLLCLTESGLHYHIFSVCLDF